MGDCDYLLYFTRGPHENCQLMTSVPFEVNILADNILYHLASLKDYLASCQTVGQPLFDYQNNCFADSTVSPSSLLLLGQTSLRAGLLSQ